MALPMKTVGLSPLDLAVRDAKRQAVQRALRDTKTLTEAAQALGIARSYLLFLMRQFQIPRGDRP